MPDLPDFDTDEAISAALDNELDGFAAELGLEASELHARMTARPEYRDRLTAMESAHAAVRTPVDAVDDVTRARLLRAASVDSAADAETIRRARASRMLRALGAAAAVVLVVGGGIVLLTRAGTDGNGGGAKSAATAGRTGTVRSGDLGDLGALDSGKLDSLIGGPSARSRKESADPKSPTNAADTADRGHLTTSAGGTAPAALQGVPPATPEQIAVCRAEYAKVATVRFSGTGEYAGRTAVVLGVESGGRTIVFVVAANDCANVLVSVSR